MHNRSIQHGGLAVVESGHVPQHLRLLKLIFRHLPQAVVSVFSGIRLDSRCNRNMKEEVSDPFLVEEIKLHLNVCEASDANGRPINDIYTTGSTAAAGVFCVASVETMKVPLTIRPATDYPQRLGPLPLQPLDVIGS
jgi:hypothetical protein